MKAQESPQLTNLPVEVRTVLEAFHNGSLPAGQLDEALSRAWSREARPVTSALQPSSAVEYAAAR